MASEKLEEKNIIHLLQAASHLVRFAKKQMWLDYDEEVDVLYLHFESLPASNHSEMREDGIILDYNDDRLVGITILDASKR
ncbi:hypothetical protein C6502_05105 [Candidatus Poribacteria bacterium]|nr:MAG: hypothetical protein C6502_05105 [Candidatus Poribacteria bacterium]